MYPIKSVPKPIIYAIIGIAMICVPIGMFGLFTTGPIKQIGSDITSLPGIILMLWLIVKYAKINKCKVCGLMVTIMEIKKHYAIHRDRDGGIAINITKTKRR